MNWLDIREAGPADAGQVGTLLAGAFPSRAEADLVAALREAGDVALELVAEVDGEIVGSGVFPKLASDAGLAVAALAPLAVRADGRRQGLGAELVHQGLIELRARGYDWCLVLGDPAYYGRFGFSAEKASGFATSYDGPHQQAVALKLPGAPASGALAYPAAFAALG
jgi:putative acetyltransferase